MDEQKNTIVFQEYKTALRRNIKYLKLKAFEQRCNAYWEIVNEIYNRLFYHSSKTKNSDNTIERFVNALFDSKVIKTTQMIFNRFPNYRIFILTEIAAGIGNVTPLMIRSDENLLHDLNKQVETIERHKASGGFINETELEQIKRYILSIKSAIKEGKRYITTEQVTGVFVRNIK